MNRFKFFVGKTGYGFDELPEPLYLPEDMVEETEADFTFSESDPSWMWCQEMGVLDLDNRESVTIHSMGIRDFLSNFPRHYIVPVISITGGGRTHTSDNTGEGWGFDIQNDPITVTYLRV